MRQNESELNANLNSSTTMATPSHSHLERDTPAADAATLDPRARLDESAMQSARRAQNRQHRNEERTPGNSIFSK